jgi:hypothetical protein
VRAPELPHQLDRFVRSLQRGKLRGALDDGDGPIRHEADRRPGLLRVHPWWSLPVRNNVGAAMSGSSSCRSGRFKEIDTTALRSAGRLIRERQS